ncbi:hypothetical protein, partial [Streptomyces sp. NPDC054887]
HGACLSRMRGKLARPVLRGPGISNGLRLPDHTRTSHSSGLGGVSVLEVEVVDVGDVDGEALGAAAVVLEVLLVQSQRDDVLEVLSDEAA